MANHSYQALQPDEISLDVGDVVNVSRKMADGITILYFIHFLKLI